jgi:hypothetical protein
MKMRKFVPMAVWYLFACGAAIATNQEPYDSMMTKAEFRLFLQTLDQNVPNWRKVTSEVEPSSLAISPETKKKFLPFTRLAEKMQTNCLRQIDFVNRSLRAVTASLELGDDINLLGGLASLWGCIDNLVNFPSDAIPFLDEKAEKFSQQEASLRVWYKELFEAVSEVETYYEKLDLQMVRLASAIESKFEEDSVWPKSR